MKKKKGKSCLFFYHPKGKYTHKLTVFIHFHNSYPRGLIIAFKLKSTSDEVPSDQSVADQHNSAVPKTGEEPEIAAGENERKVDEENNETKEAMETGGQDNNEMKEAKETGSQDNNEMKEAKETESEEKNETKETNETEGGEKKRQAGDKFSAAAYKDNMDVVSREDLRSVFEKFGTVKVLVFPPSSNRVFCLVCFRFRSCLLITHHPLPLEFVFLFLEGYFSFFLVLFAQPDVRLESFY